MTTTTKLPVLDLTKGTERRPSEPFAATKAWTRGSLRPSEWSVPVSDAVKRELAAVVTALRQQTLPMLLLRREHFELAASRRMMAEAKHMTDTGRGFTMIDRLPLDDWSEEEGRTVYWLLGQLFSQPVAQSSKGTIFREVVNAEGNFGYGHNGANGTGRLTYHSDNSGNRLLPTYAALLCLHGAEAGGESQYCSLYTMYNALLAAAPDALERLFQPFLHDRQGKVPDGEPQVLKAPAITYDDQRLTSRFSMNKIRSGYSKAGEDLDERTEAAMETLVDLIDAKKLAAEYLMERGHIQIINNREGLHHRSAFREGPVHKRHMVRLWMRDMGRPFYDG